MKIKNKTAGARNLKHKQETTEKCEYAGHYRHWL